MPNLTDESYQQSHTLAFTEFLIHPADRCLYAYMNANNDLIFNTSKPPKPDAVDFIAYFIRMSDEEVDANNIQELVQHGRTSGDPLESMLHVLKGIYVPTFLRSKHWPESVRREFSGQVQKFMASLTDRAYQKTGQTVLYMPVEEFTSAKEAAQDKDLSQRLESIVIHWTRQIKEVVNNQNMVQHAESSGPGDEIEFWHNRTIDLSGISNQLVKPEVQNIIEVLQIAKSSYLSPFQTLSKSIQQGTSEAKDNLKFLKTLEDSCNRLVTASPPEIPDILKEMLSLIRMIWSLSRFYNTEERLTGLLRKVSNQIIKQCRAHVSLSDIFEGDVFSAIKCLEENIACWKEWHNIYNKTAWRH